MSEVVHPPESIYNVLPREEEREPKQSRYVSRFRPTVVLQEKSAKDAMRTMGPAKVEMTPPDKYLKKHSTESRSPDKTRCLKEPRTCTMRKPPVPARTDPPPMGVHTKRNLLKTLTAAPVKPKPAYADSSKGHKQLLENSGLVPKYIRKKHYGEVPEYLQQRNQEEQRDQQEYNNFVKDQTEQGAIKYLRDEERRVILEGLKKNWDQLHREYQGLSFVIDTMSKKAHKERLEAAMKQLEDDIHLFEKFKTIYVPRER